MPCLRRRRLFTIVKIIGAAYLLWLGIEKWRDLAEVDGAGAAVTRSLFLGLLVNLTNPKAIVFMAALVPQFIDPHAVQWPPVRNHEVSPRWWSIPS